MKNKFFYLLIGSIVFFACKNKSVGSISDISQTKKGSDIILADKHRSEDLILKDFLLWCADKDNEINKSKEIGELRYNLMYMPTESMAYLELRRQNYNYERFRTMCDNYKNMVYFNFKIELRNGKTELLKYELQNPSQYEQRIKYIAFDMQKDIYIVQGKDTVTPDLYQFERIFNVAPYSTVMMAFDSKKINKSKELSLVYNDKLFEKGFIKFNYKNEQLIDIPNVTGL